ncbi:MAG: prefoldin subunit [Candidatus Kariarchaeaceae archaeon]
MSRSLTPEQQQELQQLQQLSQQLNIMNQNYIQMENRKRELERTITSIKDLPDDHEIYNSVGQVLFKSNVPDVKKNISEQLEMLDVRVNQSKKQIEEIDKRVKDGEAKLRASIQ